MISLFDIEKLSREELNSDKEINIARLEYALNLGKNLSYCPLLSANAYHRGVMTNYLKMPTEQLLTCSRAKEIPLDLAKYDRLFIVYIICSWIWSDKNNSQNGATFKDEAYEEYLRTFSIDDLIEINTIANRSNIKNTPNGDIFMGHSLPDITRVIWKIQYEELKQKDIIDINYAKSARKCSYILKLAYDENDPLYNNLLIHLKDIIELYTLTWTSLLLHLDANLRNKLQDESDYECLLRQNGVESSRESSWIITQERLFIFSLRVNQQDPFYIISQNDLNKTIENVIDGFLSLKPQIKKNFVSTPTLDPFGDLKPRVSLSFTPGGLVKEEIVWRKLMSYMSQYVYIVIHSEHYKLNSEKNRKALVYIKVAIMIYLSRHNNEESPVTSTMFMLKYVNGIY